MKVLLLLLTALASLALGQTALELEVLQRTNQARLEHGLPPLQWENLAYKAAMGHAQDMLNRNYFAHETPEGLTSADRMWAAGLMEVVCGENLASFSGYPDGEIPQRSLTGWMNSPGHRANLLNSNYTHLGVALVRKGDKVMVVQNFVGRPFDPQITRTPTVAQRAVMVLVGSAPGKLGVFVGGGLYAALESVFNTRLELPPGAQPNYALYDGKAWMAVQPGQHGLRLTGNLQKIPAPGTLVRFSLPAGRFNLSVGAQPRFWENLDGPAQLELTLPNTLEALWIGIRQGDQIHFTERISLGK
ncbi:MAG: CAP domain-containing protein [Thermaceae bacterium]|nr:CAP domain-containing protein [Thermaceae bacterium]